MSLLRNLIAGIRALLYKQDTDRDLDDELHAYLESSAADKMKSGLARDEAFRAARLEMRGSPEGVKEIVRASTWEHLLETIWQDIRYAARQLRRSPAFAAVAILALALGIGANTAIFSAVNAILLDPFPYPNSSRLVTIGRSSGQRTGSSSFAEFRAIERQSTAFERMALYQESDSLILGGAIPERRWVSCVTADFFPMLGVQPLLGRPILPEDVQAGHNRVAVLSYRFWMDAFGGDSRVIGRGIYVDDKPYTVVGVMPREFEMGVDWTGEGDEGLWAPLVPVASQEFWPINTTIARLRPGVTLPRANAELRTIASRLVAQDPKTEKGVQFSAAGLKRSVNPGLRTALLILLGAVGFVLLMASVNVSALLVARAWTRQKEIAIRKTLGATPLRIVRQLFSESLLLAFAGGALGLLFSSWGMRVLRNLAPPRTPRLDHFVISGPILWFTLGIALLTAFLFGLAPALQASFHGVGGPPNEGLTGPLASAASTRSHWSRNSLIIIEVALAVILVTGGALMVRSFEKLTHLNTGVRTDHVLTMSVQFSYGVCDKENLQACTLVVNGTLDHIRSLAGVQRAAIAMGGPIGGGAVMGEGLFVEGQHGNEEVAAGPFSGLPITPGYLATLGTPFLAGRDLVDGDVRSSPMNVLVSQSFARNYIQGTPLGRKFSLWTDAKGHRVWLQIVGVVGDVRDHAVHKLFGAPSYYMPYFAANDQDEFVVRTSVSPMTMAPAIERVISSEDKKATIVQLETLDQVIADSSAEPRFQAVLLGSFGALALLLAIIGIYGVMSYSVIQRTYEIGVRMALGAQPSQVMRLVVGQGARLALAGVLLGLAGAWALTRVLRNLLFEIKPTDPFTFAGAATLLLLVALVACYIPARRAMRVDPLKALRHD